MTLLEVDSLLKRYGKNTAVNGVSFRVEKGQVFGLLGPNGSGKTTLLGCLTGILIADQGSFSWFGNEEFSSARKRIGALIETPNFYPYLSAWKNLEIVAKIKGCELSRIDVVLKEVELFDRKNDAFKTFSLGMKQRLAIAGALLCDPEILVLDEPTNGLDPQGINEIRQLILRQKANGKTIVLASHLLNEVEKVCTDVVILKKGNVLSSGKVEQLLTENKRIELGSNDLSALRNAIQSFTGISNIQDRNGFLIADLADDLDAASINKQLQEKGILLNHLVVVKSDLESEFLKLVQK
ncbi:MAG TPA: ABC transporter ATP-binding protein [Flavobacteriales bacterium]|nr:ABC transporter ATP-binding protein [Flavobacteriales bacterium]HPH83420.1 ABC transporter ATP-binding protein [Flavobacteriales bacterium]